jgi:hypothetical protein
MVIRKRDKDADYPVNLTGRQSLTPSCMQDRQASHALTEQRGTSVVEQGR